MIRLPRFFLALIAVFLAAGLSSAEEADRVKPAGWSQEIAFGYAQTAGNTQNSQLTASYEGKRSRPEAEIEVAAQTLYSSENKKMNGRKHSGTARYAPNLGQTDWYNFYKLEAQHDEFAGLEYRLLPSAGVGYWLLRRQERRLLVETGLGYEYTEYIETGTKEAFTLIPRVFAETKIFRAAGLSQELIYYPSMEDRRQYRFRAQTRLTNPLSEKLSLQINFIEEYNSRPAENAKKSDWQLFLSLAYKV